MARQGLQRRRFLAITAAAIPVLSGDAASIPAWRWDGSVLGATGSLTLYHPDAAAARRLVARCLDEIGRLEAIFSLYRPGSELSRLNRDGHLAAPSLDLRWLLTESLRFAAASSGAFDVTVQPLYALYAVHFARRPEDSDGPPAEEIGRALAVVDYRAVEVRASHIRLRRPGAAITLNGIAQGYVADRVADLLRDAGLRHVLADLGEVRALQGHPDGTPWYVGVRDPRRTGHVLGALALADQAMATSAGDATRFDRSGLHHHLFDPATGHSARQYRSVTVTAQRAVTADALSTAAYIMPRAAARALLAGLGARAWVTIGDTGQEHRLEEI